MIKLLFFVLAFATVKATDIVIIVPGTWAANAAWWQPGGDFFCAVATTASRINARVISCAWSGKLDNAARVDAAHELAQLLRSLDCKDRITIIAHSHGANVVNRASHLLDQEIPIAACYFLGPPCNQDDALPNMHVIDQVYVFFSYADWVQTVHGLYQRAYPAHERITHFLVKIDGVHPGHSQLHHPLIGKWLLMVPWVLAHTEHGDFHTCTPGIPGVISFWHHAVPTYHVDPTQEQDLQDEQDFWYRLSLGL